jgi:FKBP-type peptidyl-prolyl cis-trans isomerase SlyD
MKVAAGNIVKIEVELRVKGGDVIESSARTGPVQYTQGEGKLLPALEKRVEGMVAGEEKQGEIPAKEAFGVEEALPTKDIPRKEFPKDAKLQQGMVFQAKGPQGEPVSFKVVKVGPDQVTVRFMHPLVGKDLQFKVKVLMIDDPKARKRAVTIPPVPAEALLNPDDIKPE